MKRIYLDHSATTPVDEEVLQKMLPYFTGKFGNANSMHGFGQEGAYAVDESRRKIASLIGAKPNEIYFTSGGTEADNWAIKGMALKMREKGNHVITSSIEHAAIMSSCAQIAKEYGFEITYLKFGRNRTSSLTHSMDFTHYNIITFKHCSFSNDYRCFDNSLTTYT